MPPTLATLWLLLPQAPLETALEEPFELTQELLDSALALARPAVERELGHALAEGFAGIRLGTPAEIRSAVERENAPVFAAIFGEELGGEQARAFAEAVAPALLAKYVFDERAVLVSAEALEVNARLLAQPELESAAVVRAIVAHELVHADDVPRHDFAGLCARAGDLDRIQALNAVLEGHAQLVARRACAAMGEARGFERMTQAIAGEPAALPDLGEGVRLMQRIQRRTFGALYLAGERFMAAVDAKEARGGMDRAFREPPRDMAEVHRPEWYLDPLLRPSARLELERALDAFEAEYEERGWKGQRLSIDAAQLATAFEGFEEAAVKRVQAALVRGRLIQLSPPDRSKMHYALLCEWSSSADAAFVLELSQALLKRRDQDLQEGAIRIASATYEPVAEPAFAGIYGRKRVQAFDEEVDVATAVVGGGPLTMELLRSGDPGTKAELLALAARLLAAAQVAEGPAPAPEAPEEPVPAGRAPGAGTGGGGGG